MFSKFACNKFNHNFALFLFVSTMNGIRNIPINKVVVCELVFAKDFRIMDSTLQIQSSQLFLTHAINIRSFFFSTDFIAF